MLTDDPYVQSKFQDKLCPGKIEHPVHTPVAGKYIAASFTNCYRLLYSPNKLWLQLQRLQSAGPVDVHSSTADGKANNDI